MRNKKRVVQLEESRCTARVNIMAGKGAHGRKRDEGRGGTLYIWLIYKDQQNSSPGSETVFKCHLFSRFDGQKMLPCYVIMFSTTGKYEHMVEWWEQQESRPNHGGVLETGEPAQPTLLELGGWLG